MYNDGYEKKVLQKGSVCISYNEGMGYAHIAFAHKPDIDMRLDLRSHEWRWNPYAKVWYRPLNRRDTRDEVSRFIGKWYKEGYEGYQEGAYNDTGRVISESIREDDEAVRIQPGHAAAGKTGSGNGGSAYSANPFVDGKGIGGGEGPSKPGGAEKDDISFTGIVPESIALDDSGPGFGVGDGDVHKNGAAGKRSEYPIGLEPAGKRSLADIRRVRQQCRALLEQKSKGFSEEELELLRQYEGGGGSGEAHAQRHEVLYEFYTPKPVIGFVWKIIDAYTQTKKTLHILEPAAGSGRFLDGRPGSNTFTAYELDPVSAKINKILHPDAQVYNEAYQKQFFDASGRQHTGKGRDVQFDVVIGNPPYGVYADEWKGLGEGRHHTRYEEYFIERSLDALKEGGLLAFVLPSSFLSKGASPQKGKIAEKGKLLEAWRLPEKTFAATDVAADIVVFQKGGGDQNVISNNNYFNTHPHHILGEQRTRTDRFGKQETYVALGKGETLNGMLAKASADGILVKEYQSQQIHIEAKPSAGYTKEGARASPARAGGKKEAGKPPAAPPKDEAVAKATLDVQAFCKKYGRAYNEAEYRIWQRVEFDGVIRDLSGFSQEEYRVLREGMYCEIQKGQWMHHELYTSGNIYERIDELEASNLDEGTKKENREALMRALPEAIPFSQISFSPQSGLAKEFMVNIAGQAVNLQEGFIDWGSGYLRDGDRTRWAIDFESSPINKEDIPQGISWFDIVAYMDGVSVRAERAWTAEAADVKKMEAEEKRTLRRDCANALFNRYLHEGLGEEDQGRLCDVWNRRFNGYKGADYGKLPLFLNGMSPYKGEEPFTLYGQQLKGVSFLCSKGNGLLAYDVGVGKTAAGIAATVNQIQSGRAERPLIMVPKSVYDKWETDLRELFPGVTVNSLGNFGESYLKPYQSSKDPHALIIPPHSISLCTNEALQRITFGDGLVSSVLYESFHELLGVQEEAGETERERQLNVQRIMERIGEASQAKDNYIFFERTRFDHITVDEAHRFKNLYSIPRNPERGKANEYKGLAGGKPSARALKLFAVTQLIQYANKGRNVFLLTATPFSNSPLEVYSMLSFIARKELQDKHIYNLYSFLNEFTEMKSEWAVTAKGEIESKLVMKNFRQLGPLQRMLQQYIDKVDGLEAGVIRPQKVVHIEKLEMTGLQKQIVQAETERMDDPGWAKRGGVLVSMNNMRQAMLSPALLEGYDIDGIKIPKADEIVSSSPKLQFVLESVAQNYKKVPDGGQVIYMPRGVNGFKYLKEYLVKKGVPKEAVAWIDASASEAQRENITKAFNDKNEKLKILIGSETISEGVDLNGNSYALYNLMLGWNPTEPVQVEGRIWRQGNEQGTVHIVYPLLYDSIDTLIYQKYDEKASRIDALWSYKGDTLNVEDIKPEELKFDLIKDPEKKARFVIDQQEAQLRKDIRIEQCKIESVKMVLAKREEAQKPLPYYHRHTDQRKKIGQYDAKLKKMGLSDDEAISAYIKKHSDKVAYFEQELLRIKGTFEGLAAQYRSEMQETADKLASPKEAAKALSASIVNNLSKAEKRQDMPAALDEALAATGTIKPPKIEAPKMREIEMYAPLFDENRQGLLFDFSEFGEHKTQMRARRLKANTANNLIENVVIRGAQLHSNIKAYQELFTSSSKQEQKKMSRLMHTLCGSKGNQKIRQVIESWDDKTDYAAITKKALKARTTQYGQGR